MSDIFLSDPALRTDGVRRSDDGASGLQRGDDAGFGDGDALLLHGLVDTRPVCIVHLQDGVRLEVCLQSAHSKFRRRTVKDRDRLTLSNSSIRHTPRSASTSAPASSVHSRLTGCLWTYAVRPTAEAP